MRDLYHRHDKLAYWIQRVYAELEEPDKTDILKLIEHMQDREKAILWITRCITALLLMRKQLGKPFRDASKDEIFPGLSNLRKIQSFYRYGLRKTAELAYHLSLYEI
jgi:hypothetical protein